MSQESAFINDNPVPIIDGYITIKFGPHTIKQRVKQTKGRGTYDADDLLIPKEEHLEYIAFFYSNDLGFFTSMQIFEKINHNRKLKCLATSSKLILIRQSTHTRIFSELLRKKIITKSYSEGTTPYYAANKDYCLKVMTERKF